MKKVHICGNYDDSEKENYCMWWLSVRGGEKQEGKKEARSRKGSQEWMRARECLIYDYALYFLYY